MSQLLPLLRPFESQVTTHLSRLNRRMSESLAALLNLSSFRSLDWQDSPAAVRHGFFVSHQLLLKRLSVPEARRTLEAVDIPVAAYRSTCTRDRVIPTVSSDSCLCSDTINKQFDAECYVLTADALVGRGDGPSQTYVKDAFHLIHVLGFSRLVDVAVECVVHLKYRDPVDSMSSYTLFPLSGTVFTDWTDNPLRYAESIVHEAAHSYLNYIVQIEGIDPTRPQKTFWSPWRACFRPSFGIVHGMWAFAFVLDFYEVLFAAQDKGLLTDKQRGYCAARITYERSRLQEVQLSLADALADLDNATVAGLLQSAARTIDSGVAPSYREEYA